MNRSLPALFFLAFLALPAQAEIYKCRLPNGQTEISNSPCPSGSGTLKVRPDEAVSEQSRQQAERDVARMRDYVEKREATKRLDEVAEREQRAAGNQASAQQAVYQSANMDECLNVLAQYSLEAGRRAELEAICRAKPKSEPVIGGVPVPVPYYRGAGRGNSRDSCVENVMRLQLPAAEQNRRLALCHGDGGHPPPPIIRPVEPPPPRPGMGQKPTVAPCPLGKNNCAR